MATNFTNKYWLKQYLTEKFSKSCKETGITYKLQLIPTEKSKLPTLNIEVHNYLTGDTLLQIKNGNQIIFTKISPIKNQHNNVIWYNPSSYRNGWHVDNNYKKEFKDVLKNLNKVKVPSAQNSELIKSWNNNLA